MILLAKAPAVIHTETVDLWAGPRPFERAGVTSYQHNLERRRNPSIWDGILRF